MTVRQVPPGAGPATAAPAMSVSGFLDRHGRRLVILVPYVWLALFFLVPCLIVLKLSFSEAILAQPPYAPLVRWVEEEGYSFLTFRLNISNYLIIFNENIYIKAYLSSAWIAAIATLMTLAVGLPMAYAIARAPVRWRLSLIMLVILPFWTSFLIRVYAWIGILKNEGVLNGLLLWLGLIDAPLVILNTNAAVYIGIVYAYLPFMILPIYASLEKMDASLVEAAVDLGCHPVAAFWRITVPIARPGIVAGCLLVFIPAVGEFVIPDLLGGSETLMIGRSLWVEFFNNRDWPLASAVAVLLLLVLIVPISVFQWSQRRARGDAGAAAGTRP